MTKTVPVSVVVPCHEAAATVSRALESVAAQAAHPLEVIVVDDASSGHTVNVLEAVARRDWPFLVRLEMLHENRGPGEARNTGCGLADHRARYIAFLDADDRMRPHRLQLPLEIFAREPSLDLVVCDFIRFEQDTGAYLPTQFALVGSWRAIP